MASPGTKNELNTLIQRYLNGEASPQEIAFVESYYAFFEQRDGLTDTLDEHTQTALQQRILSKVNDEIDEVIPVPARKIIPFRNWIPAVAAALILLMGGIAAFWLYQKGGLKSRQNVTARVTPQNDIPPGIDGAILTLAGGEQMIIDSMQNGAVHQTHGNGITRLNGVLVIKANTTTAGAAIANKFNTLTTPRARQCQLLLPDGSRVWINAASSVKFPETFSGTSREVEITGEAYFEIANDPAKPFLVKVNNSSIEVLGTHFNVMAYGNENKVQTTLLEGAVRFKHQNSTILLEPGEQCTLRNNGAIKKTTAADLEFVTAWKNGRQVFKNADIQTVMRQVERWYDLDVVYNGPVAQSTFSGSISRTASLSQVLKMLELSDIHFELDQQNKKLIVKP